MILSCAPLQGYTEFPFRNALHQYIGGIDRFYAPYIRIENDGSIKNKYLRDIHPDNNQGVTLIPQVLVNKSNDFLRLAKIIEDFGYSQVNWNLGCPFPMVAKRKLGSGLIPYPNEIQRILEEVLSKTTLLVSIKIRAGYEKYEEVLEVLQICADLPLHEVILHPRIGKQLYKGEANIEAFLYAQSQTNFNLVYNGDITTRGVIEKLQNFLPLTTHFMIGRGLISNPFLALEIKNGYGWIVPEKKRKFKNFHDHLINHYTKSLSGETQVLMKMISYWEYFSQMFENDKKIVKALKKSRQISEFQSHIDRILDNNLD